MKKHKNLISGADSLDIRYFLHQPHDKFVRSLLQYRYAALKIIQFALPQTLLPLLNLKSLKLSNTTFVDEKLQLSLADICYEGMSKAKKPFRICLLFEHKSDSTSPLYEQLNRYINNIWLEDQKQARPSTLSIPILIHHGDSALEKETPARLFPDAPPELLRFVPHFDYILLDLAALTEEAIEKAGLKVLKNVFLALKYSRNEVYLQQNWKKIIIFAKEFGASKVNHYIIQATITYMTSISKTVRENLEKMDSVLTPQETEMVRPYFLERYFQDGMEKGMEKGVEKGILLGEQKGILMLISKYLVRNPEANDEDVAKLFDIDIALVKKARESNMQN